VHGDHGPETDHPVASEEDTGQGDEVRVVEGTAGYKPHESPLVMAIPVGVLAVGAVASGFVFKDFFIGAGHDAFWNGSITIIGENILHQMHEPGVMPAWVPWSPFVAMVIGFLLALNSYVLNTNIPAAFARTFRGLYTFLYRKWFFDELYEAVFVRPAAWFGRVFWKKGDGAIIDGLGPDGLSAAVATVAVKSRRIQTGYVFTYAFAMLIGVAAAVSWFLPKLFSE